MVNAFGSVVWKIRSWWRTFRNFRRRGKPFVPENEKYWTTLYFGHRGSGKSQHQAKEAKKIFEYFEWLYKKQPHLKKAIVFSVQKFGKEIEDKYKDSALFYWTDPDEFRWCPRIKCWRGKAKHRLHGAYLIFDDVAAMFPNDPGTILPPWMVKTFSQARKFGIRMLANCQDPFSVNIDFRRYVDQAFKFQKIFATRDPDETRPALKFIFGMYRRRSIKAEVLWQFGDMSEIDIKMMKMKEKEKAEAMDMPDLFGSMWRASWHYFDSSTVNIYDTLQEIKEFEPKGFMHTTLTCIDPRHDHVDKKAANYCGFKKVSHELV